MLETNRILELLERYDSLATRSIKCLDAEHWQISLNELREKKEKLKQELLTLTGKPVAKKVLIDSVYAQVRYTVAVCPTCGVVLGLLSFVSNYKHCTKCDQLLDWSDINEL